MSDAVTVTVDDSKVLVNLGRFRLSLQQKEELMSEIGTSMLVSVRKTFRDQGVPAGSWAPLSPNTITRNPKKYGPGHKLLIDSGRLLNSITAITFPSSVTIGTSLVYAAVHQFGSRDRGSVAIGPRTKAQSEAVVNVKERSYYRRSAELGTDRMVKADRNGRMRSTLMKIAGPRNAKLVHTRAHTRHQNIPARPFLVFRPEDGPRIRGIVVRYINKRAAEAGLGGTE